MKQYRFRILGYFFTIVLLFATSPGTLIAQEPAGAPGRAAAAVEKPPTEIEKCQAEKKKLVGKLFEYDAYTAGLEQKQKTCEAKHAVALRSNINLKKELDARTVAGNTINALEDEIEELSKKLRQAQAAEKRLKARLAKFDISPREGFSYLTRDVHRSFVGQRGAREAFRSSPKLTSDKCRQVLDWLAGLKNKSAPYRWAVWVWKQDKLNVCRSGPGGSALVAKPVGGDEAHVVILQ